MMAIGIAGPFQSSLIDRLPGTMGTTSETFSRCRQHEQTQSPKDAERSAEVSLCLLDVKNLHVTIPVFFRDFYSLRFLARLQANY